MIRLLGKGLLIHLVEILVQQTQLLLHRFTGVVDVCVPFQVTGSGHPEILHGFGTRNWGGVNLERSTRLMPWKLK